MWTGREPEMNIVSGGQSQRAPARSRVSSQSMWQAAESRVEASVRPAVEVPHCLAHLYGHAAPRLKKLPGRAAKGQEALGEVDPQHMYRVRSGTWLGGPGHALYMVYRQRFYSATVGAPGCSVKEKQGGEKPHILRYEFSRGNSSGGKSVSCLLLSPSLDY